MNKNLFYTNHNHYKMTKIELDKELDKEKKLEKKRQKALKKKEKAYLLESLEVDEEQLKELEKKLRKVESQPDRGIETWFRLASRNLYTRRRIVDTKTHYLITVNTILISALMSTLYPRLNDEPHLVFGIFPIILGNLISIFFAIMATLPKFGNGKFSEDAPQNTSLMTFDDYYKMPLAAYEAALDKIMLDKESLYGSIKKDLHRLGVDLGRRYNNIRIGYHVFLAGLVIGLVAFGLCSLLY